MRVRMQDPALAGTGRHWTGQQGRGSAGAAGLPTGSLPSCRSWGPGRPRPPGCCPARHLEPICQCSWSCGGPRLWPGPAHPLPPQKWSRGGPQAHSRRGLRQVGIQGAGRHAGRPLPYCRCGAGCGSHARGARSASFTGALHALVAKAAGPRSAAACAGGACSISPAQAFPWAPSMPMPLPILCLCLPQALPGALPASPRMWEPGPAGTTTSSPCCWNKSKRRLSAVVTAAKSPRSPRIWRKGDHLQRGATEGPRGHSARALAVGERVSPKRARCACSACPLALWLQEDATPASYGTCE